MIKKLLLALILLSFLMISAGCACAADLDKCLDNNNSLNEIDNQGTIEIKDSNSIENNCEADLLPSDDTIQDSNQTSVDDAGNLIDNQEPILFEGTTFSELQNKTNSLNNGDTLLLSNDVSQDGDQAIIINNSITIDGNGFTMDAKRCSSAFVVFAPNVTLKNIQFTNGMPAILWSGINGTLSDCTFKDNIGYNKGMILLIDTTTFKEIKLNKTIGVKWDDTIPMGKTFPQIYPIYYADSSNKLGFKFINNTLISGMDREEYNKLLNAPKVVEFNGTTSSELQKQIKKLNNGDTINLNNDIYLDTTTDIKIYESITINGNGHTIDGKHISRIIEVCSENVVLNNINFINGNTAIKWSRAKGTVNGCSFRNSKGILGAIEWIGNDGTIKNCTFIGNTATNGGAIYLEGNDCKIEGCIFQKNKAESGGAIDIGYKNHKNVFNLAITSCTFLENTATVYGGAICGNCENTKVSNCTFKQNTAQKGGAIEWITYKCSVTGSTFEKNSADNGGAIFWEGKMGNVEKCYFEGNTATDNGGAIYWDTLTGHNTKLIDCDFYLNKAKNSIIYAKNGYASYVEIEIKRCNFYANTATNIIHWWGEAHIRDCIFLKNNGMNIMNGYYFVYVDDCWFGNTQSNPAANMANVDKDVTLTNWYILNDDFTTSNPKIYQKNKVAPKRITTAKNFNLRLSEELRLKLLQLAK